MIYGAMASAHALTEQQLAGGYALALGDYMRDQGERAYFTSDDGLAIHYQRFDGDCNNTAVIILPGWSEPFLKYAEVIYDLRQQRYCVYAMDFRGQGMSPRGVADPQKTHVMDFSQYVNDLRQFHREVIAPQEHQRSYLLAHSMGGLVATMFVSEQPEAVDGLILIAPMLGINTGAWPRWMAYTIVSFLDWMGFGDSYVIGHGPWQETPFADNPLTHSKERYQFGVDWFRNHPELVVGGVSNRWLKTAMDSGDEALRMAPQLKSRMLMFEADQDAFVAAKPMRQFCDSAPRCERVFLPDSRHELLMETDAIRDRVFARIYEFLNAHE